MRQIAGAVAAAALLVLAGGSALRAQILEEILVKVNGEIFTKTDLEQRQIMTLRQRGDVVDPRTDPQGLQLQRQLNEITPKLMVDVIDEMLLVQRGRELGYRLTDDQFKAAVDSIKTENHLESEEQFNAALKQEGMTMEDLRRNFERQAIIARVEQAEVFGKVGVTEEEARVYYETHADQFRTPASVTLREILVRAGSDPASVSAADDEAAKARMDRIRARLAAGEPFETLAAEASDAPSKANAGLIGPLNLDDISADLRQVIERMKVGQVSEPIRTPRGYQIFQLESMTPVETMPFEKARELISQQVFTGKREAEFERYKETLRQQAIIEWKNAEVQRAYEIGLKQPAAGA
ncbi:MAG: peptidyl-prolyl cis-trans isomerase [Acidobacteria bacterium]|nr:peptidyl-prolyl cis-trans isomerase [Acidobacteriota bacterium]